MCIVLVRKFGWNIYRNVGADIQKTLILKRRYNYGIVIKFKAFFIFGIILQCIVFNNKETEFTWDEDNFLDNFLDMTKIYKFFLTYSVYILIGVYIINIICGMFAVKYESKPLMVVHIITDIIFIVYAIYIIYVIYFENIYQYILISLTGFAAIEIILILVSIYFSVIVMVDFNSVDLSENKQQLGRRLSL
ncbi:hypothetical protein BCR32DRAFT_147452 [Anaeromyces robustus]|uniref:Uncharacterized protein n=1 Tax=Anaeromyces robustus TaxID=1754192 RepID=A0A1Y1XPG3_9FUNG|nr:hypothetical protein BCR32DRAFT_147452 [Anaeromyces robustus]|eukprot:ORX87621.1 hypothetical protein BCR32DRAFT_147452 [Anaeromyces robustus]